LLSFSCIKKKSKNNSKKKSKYNFEKKNIDKIINEFTKYDKINEASIIKNDVKKINVDLRDKLKDKIYKKKYKIKEIVPILSKNNSKENKINTDKLEYNLDSESKYDILKLIKIMHHEIFISFKSLIKDKFFSEKFKDKIKDKIQILIEEYHRLFRMNESKELYVYLYSLIVKTKNMKSNLDIELDEYFKFKYVTLILKNNLQFLSCLLDSHFTDYIYTDRLKNCIDMIIDQPFSENTFEYVKNIMFFFDDSKIFKTLNNEEKPCYLLICCLMEYHGGMSNLMYLYVCSHANKNFYKSIFSYNEINENIEKFYSFEKKRILVDWVKKCNDKKICFDKELEKKYDLWRIM
jgi:hypothetical protein